MSHTTEFQVTPTPPAQTAGVRPGDTIAGKYRIERVLGQGGMGVVVAAHHLLLDNRVAIKFLLPEMLECREAIARFANEARAAVKITSEHVARVLDVGTLETGAPYMVMEFLDGVDLAHWLDTHGALAIEQAVDFVLQTCVAVAEAHTLRIVHRDLKPANLFCTRGADGQLAIKVLDFGISKRSDVSVSVRRITQTSTTMGSPLYMSPEQMQSARDVDSRTDIWSLGVILYELLSGKTPFCGETMPEVCVKIATSEPASLRAMRNDVPEGLERVVRKCLEKDRARRFCGVGDLATSLLEFASPRGRASLERISGTLAGKGLAETAPFLTGPSELGGDPVLQTILPVGRTIPATSRRRTTLLLGIFCALVALTGLVGIWTFGRSRLVQPTSQFAVGARVDSPPVNTEVHGAASSVAPREIEITNPADVLAERPALSPPRPVHPARPVRPVTTSVSIPTPAPRADEDAKSQPTATISTASPRPPPRCDVPYAYDAAGTKVFKKECL